MRRLLACTVLVVALAGLAVGCGGGDNNHASSTGEPIDAYYASLRSVGNEFVDALSRQPEGIDTSKPIAEQVNVYEAYTRGLSADIRKARDGLAGISPPPEVADLHIALAASVENALTVAESFESSLGAIESATELQQLVGSPQVADAFASFKAACNALKDYATQHNIAGTVRCE